MLRDVQTRLRIAPVHGSITNPSILHLRQMSGATPHVMYWVVGNLSPICPRFDRANLEAVRIVGLPFSPGTNELDKAGLTSLASTHVAPPRIQQMPRNFECHVQWTKEWTGRLMVVGEVVAAAVDADCVDVNGFILWIWSFPSIIAGRLMAVSSSVCAT